MFTGQNLVKMHLCCVDHWCDINLKALCYWWEYRVDCTRIIHAKYYKQLKEAAQHSHLGRKNKPERVFGLWAWDLNLLVFEFLKKYILWSFCYSGLGILGKSLTIYKQAFQIFSCLHFWSQLIIYISKVSWCFTFSNEFKQF